MTPLYFCNSEDEIEKEYLTVLREKSLGDLERFLKSCGGLELALEGPGMLEMFLRPVTSFSFLKYPADQPESLARYSMTLDDVANAMMAGLQGPRFSKDQIFSLAYLSSLYIHFSKTKLFSWIFTTGCLAIIAKAASLSDFKTSLVIARYWYSFLISCCGNPECLFWKQYSGQISAMIIAALHLILSNAPEPSGNPSGDPKELQDDLRFKKFLLSFLGEGLPETPSKADLFEAFQSLSKQINKLEFQENGGK